LKSLDELQLRLKEVTELCIEEISEEELNELPKLIGIQQINVAA